MNPNILGPGLRTGEHGPNLPCNSVRKLSGFTRPSKANQIAFDHAVDEVATAARELLGSLVTNAPPRYREVEAAKARARGRERSRSSGTKRAN